MTAYWIVFGFYVCLVIGFWIGRKTAEAEIEQIVDQLYGEGGFEDGFRCGWAAAAKFHQVSQRLQLEELQEDRPAKKGPVLQ